MDEVDDERLVVCSKTKSNKTRLISLRKTKQIDSKSAVRKIRLNCPPNIILVFLVCKRIKRMKEKNGIEGKYGKYFTLDFTFAKNELLFNKFYSFLPFFLILGSFN